MKVFGPRIGLIAIGVAMALLLCAMTWNSSVGDNLNPSTAEPIIQATIHTPQVEQTPSSQPEEIPNRDQTNGIILASVILVFIILFGTVIGMRRKNPV